MIFEERYQEYRLIKKMTETELQQFKYQAKLDGLKEPCPPAEYTSVDITLVFRWVFEPIENPINFLPLSLRDPPRIQLFNDKGKCDAWALSLYNTRAAAINRFKIIMNRNPQSFKTLGTHLAVGFIQETDGVNSEVSEETGHISHHPYNTTDFAARFRILEKL